MQFDDSSKNKEFLFPAAAPPPPPPRQGVPPIRRGFSGTEAIKLPKKKPSGERDAASRTIAAAIADLKSLGFGTLTHPEIEIWIARVVLFERMLALCAKDVTELKTSTLPSYEALFQLGKQLLPYVRGGDIPHVSIETKLGPTRVREELLWINSWRDLYLAALHHPAARDLKTKLEAWARNRHLVVEWFLDALLHNLCGWHVTPDGASEHRFSMPGMFLTGSSLRFGGVSSEFHRAVKFLGSVGPPSYDSLIQPARRHGKSTLTEFWRS